MPCHWLVNTVAWWPGLNPRPRHVSFVMDKVALGQVSSPANPYNICSWYNRPITCLIRGLISKRFWFQYILFMVFVGGILVLFIYVTRLASNEIFSLSTKIIIISAIFIPRIIIIENWINLGRKETTKHEIIIIQEITTITRKLYNQPNGIITILIALYLLITLIVVVKITNISKGPLRQTN
jgi:NADH-ubiquinone oxidoreductase chain 6